MRMFFRELNAKPKYMYSKYAIPSLLVLMAFIFAGCGSARYATSTPGSTYEQSRIYAEEPDPITSSLFTSPEGTIAEADIQKILDGEITLPETIRMAILPLEGNRGRYWQSSEAYRNQQAAHFSRIKTAAAASGRVSWVNLLPQLLVSRDRNIFTLRESAVRMQADVLLIYSMNSDIYSEFKLFRKDEAKAFANVEGMLLDIRTGVVVFTTTIDAEATGTKQESDTGSEDFYRRLRSEAASKAIGEMSLQLRDFFET